MKTLLIAFIAGTLMLVFGFTKYNIPERENLSQQDTTGIITGAQLFQQNCAACHGTDLQGRPPMFPSLKEVKSRMTKEQIITLLKTGRNNMPSFAFLSEAEREALAGFLLGEKTKVRQLTTLSPEEKGKQLFMANCARCHQARSDDPQPDLNGIANGCRGRGMRPPVLAGVTRHIDPSQFAFILDRGPAYMPSFDFLTREEKNSIYLWLKTLEQEAPPYRGMMGRCR